MKVKYVNKRVTFETQESLEEKIDRLMTMMSKLTAQDDGQNKQFIQIYTRVREEDK